jgi:hypothetical protein
MITIPEAIERIVRKSPYLEEGLALGILNLSALARLIRPEVERETMKDITDGAVIVALNRLSGRIHKRTKRTRGAFGRAPELNVRSNLFEMTFANSESLPLKQKRLLEKTARVGRAFLTFTQGIHETTLIAGLELEPAVAAIFSDEKLISRIGRLSSVTVLLPPGTPLIPGVYSYILKALAWEGINVIEVVSTLNELTIILEDRTIDTAFSIIKRLF